MTDLPETTEQTSLLRGIGRGLGAASRVLGAGAVALGQSAAGAYQSVDPDLRRQAFEAPVIGLMNLVPAPGFGARSAAEEPVSTYQRDALLIHGWNGHPSNFRAIQRYFTHATGRRAHAVDLRGSESLDAMTSRLRRDIAARAHHSPTKQVDLIAHSMGGIVARQALEDPSTREQVATFITMATPHSGSHLARLAATPFTRELRPGSPTMERLAAQDFWGNDQSPHLIALWSDADTTILPAASAAWEAAQTHHMEHYTHLSYLVQPASWRFLDRLLRRTTPDLTA